MDALTLLRLAGSQLENRVGLVPPDAFDRPSPCPGMTVAEVVSHVVGGNIVAVRLLAGDSAHTALQTAARGTSGDRLGAIFHSCADQLVAFSAVPDLDALTVDHPAGPMSARRFLTLRLGDLTVHNWDIARGAGINDSLDARLAGGLLELVEPELDWMTRSGKYGSGPSGTLGPDATVQERLLDAFGRRT